MPNRLALYCRVSTTEQTVEPSSTPCARTLAPEAPRPSNTSTTGSAGPRIAGPHSTGSSPMPADGAGRGALRSPGRVPARGPPPWMAGRAGLGLLLGGRRPARGAEPSADVAPAPVSRAAGRRSAAPAALLPALLRDRGAAGRQVAALGRRRPRALLAERDAPPLRTCAAGGGDGPGVRRACTGSRGDARERRFPSLSVAGKRRGADAQRQPLGLLGGAGGARTPDPKTARP